MSVGLGGLIAFTIALVTVAIWGRHKLNKRGG